MDGLKETKAYHALAIYFRGDYGKLKKALAEHQSWTKAYQELHPAIDIDAEFEQLKIQHIHLILEGEKDFPALLTEIPWKPHALYFKGNLPDSKKLSVAIVGTRKATAQGLQYAAQFAKALAGSGLQIISGLALGMDTAAHQATLEAHGKTFAVLANGLDDVYPRQNKRLADEILKSGGGLISEYPPKTPSLPRFFDVDAESTQDVFGLRSEHRTGLNKLIRAFVVNVINESRNNKHFTVLLGGKACGCQCS
jgi:predicted Rossmann fold nucleotide-binding protein DprA/Smf involved in DNA uptake